VLAPSMQHTLASTSPCGWPPRSVQPWPAGARQPSSSLFRRPRRCRCPHSGCESSSKEGMPLQGESDTSDRRPADGVSATHVQCCNPRSCTAASESANGNTGQWQATKVLAQPLASNSTAAQTARLFQKHPIWMCWKHANFNPTPHLKDAKGEGREKLESLAPPSAAEAAAASSFAKPSGRPSPSTPRLQCDPKAAAGTTSTAQLEQKSVDELLHQLAAGLCE
jgi:hypothetical protein